MYLCGTKLIIKDALVNRQIHDRDCIALKHWIHFYEVFARFSLLHWAGKPEGLALCYQGPASHMIRIRRDQPSLVSCNPLSVSYVTDILV